MKQYIDTAKKFIIKHDEVFIGIAFVAVIAIAIAAVAYINTPKIVYEPAKACELFTPEEAGSFLGDEILSTEANRPDIQGDLATSKCSYTDKNPDQAKMLVAAVAIRSGINDEGIAKNKTDFAKAKVANNAEAVKGIGESAYFNKTNGQLNILKGTSWIIISYGVGATPQENTLEKATELAHKVVG